MEMNRCEITGDKGFSLVELMIALLIGGIIMTSVMTSFRSQHRTYLAQDQVVEMRQNARVVLDMLVRDIRLAGYDPTGEAAAGIVEAIAGQIEVTMDLNGNQTIESNERVTYRLNANTSIGRRTGAGFFQPLADNFEALEFNYLLVDGGSSLNPADPGAVRGVQVSLLARAAVADPHYTHDVQYTTPAGTVWGPYNDGLRRLMLTQTVLCRNLGF